jgi:hypothetical protein
VAPNTYKGGARLQTMCALLREQREAVDRARLSPKRQDDFVNGI